MSKVGAQQQFNINVGTKFKNDSTGPKSVQVTLAPSLAPVYDIAHT